MTSKVTLLPSNEEFSAEKNESILNAALRAGLSVAYGCNNGTCGHCIGRVISGETRPVEFHDFAIPEANRILGDILLCAYAAVTDVVIEAGIAEDADDITLQEVGTRVRKIEFPCTNVAILRTRASRTRTLRYMAGQHALLKLGDDLPARDLPLASCPCDSMNLEFHIARNPGDPFADYVFDTIRIGDEILVEGPTGHFVLDEDWTGPVVLIAYDTGFAPIRSLTEHLISLEFTPPVYLYWIASSTRGHYLENYCRSVVDAIDNFHFVPLTVPGEEAPAGESPPGRGNACRNLDQAMERLLDMHDHALTGHQLYVAGPAFATSRIAELVARSGVPRKRIFTDPLRGRS